MVSNILQVRKSKPEPQAWLLAVTSALLLSSVGYFSVLGGTYVYHQVASRMLLEELDSNRFGSAQLMLKRCVSTPPFSSLMVFNQSISSDSAEAFEGGTSQLLYNALVDLYEGNISSAQEQIEKIDPSSLISNIGALRETLEVQGPHETIENLTAAQTKKNKAEHELSKLTQDLEKSLDRHMKVARDFGDFFSLDSAYIETPNASTPLVYKSGVLKDLPKLRYLPDGLKDLNALRSQLARVGGKVNTSKLDAFQEFNDTVGALKDKSLAEVYEFNRISGRRQEAQTTRDNMTARFNSEMRLLQETLKRLIKLRADQAYFKHLDPPFWLQSLIRDYVL